jgi:uncharacterized membrane protein
VFDHWLVLFSSPLDAVGFGLFLLVFPIYHGLYPWVMKRFPGAGVKVKFDLLRRSWIEGLLERRDIVAAAQQTRNLTMVNSLLASSALILMGFGSNILIRYPEVTEGMLHPAAWEVNPEVVNAKLFLLILVFAAAFGYCMTSLRHLGHFVLVVGADPELINQLEGSAVDYFSGLINRASNRYTLAVRCLYSASPLFLWLFDTWFFILLTLFWGIKFVGFQDFTHLWRRSPALDS